MTASAVQLSRSDFTAVITTDDALLTSISCTGDIEEVTLQPLTAGAYVVLTGGSQGGAVGTKYFTIAASGSGQFQPRDVGIGEGNPWTLYVARASAGAVIHVAGKIR